MKHGSKQLLYLLLLTSLEARAAEPVYSGYYRGSTNVMPNGLYFFTNITDAAGSATRVGTTTFKPSDWQKVAFDGVNYLTFNRTSGVRQGPGLYVLNAALTLSLISSNAESGAVYTFTNWHGIGYCNPFYYGLYNGTNMAGSGLYRFTNPDDPETAAVRLFAPQTFSSDIWSDVDFDGTRYLFVRKAAAGNPGIYQYDPQTDSFTLISGAETYTDWDGLGVYGAPESPAVTNVALLHKKMYVILFGGQSNSQGYGYPQYLLDTGDSLANPQTDVDFYAGNSTFFPNTLTNLQSGSGYALVRPGVQQYPELTNAPINRFGPELSLGRTVRDRITIPGAKVAIIKCAYGGTSLYTDWLPNGTSDRATDGLKYQGFQTTVWNGLSALRTKYPDYEIEILGMGWVQGESDATGAASIAYQTNLTAFVADIRATFGTNIVFALSKISTNQQTAVVNWGAKVRDAQAAVAATVPKVVAIETIDITKYPVATGYAENSMHFLTPALLQIGRELGNAIIDASALDSDADGLPDAWENSYAPGTAGLGNSPGADYDEDGVTDIHEFQTGTSPVDPSDHLTLTNATSRMRWPAKKDVRYQMFTSSNLVSWAEFGTPVLLRDSNSTAEIDFSQYVETNRSGFFRLHVL